jgi:hypothetical protein
MDDSAFRFTVNPSVNGSLFMEAPAIQVLVSWRFLKPDSPERIPNLETQWLPSVAHVGMVAL